MSFLLDTNVVSEARKGRRANARLRTWFGQVDAADLFMSVLVVGELRRGVDRIRARDPRQAILLERWLVGIVRQYDDRLIPVDRAVANEWGRLSARRSESPVDLLMAATARVHDLVLVTRNVKHVDWTGVALLNPFEATVQPA